jgi:hypothetical protein
MPTRSLPSDDLTTSLVGTTATNTRWGCFSGRTPLILLLIHAALLFIYPPIGGSGGDDYFFFFIIAGFDYWIVNPLITISIAIALIHQATMTWSHRGETALSPIALALQVVLYLGLAIAWPYRLALPANLWPREGPTLEWICAEWYPVVGWACVNNAMIALGQAVVLFVWYRSRENNTYAVEAEQPLLT